MDKKRLINLQNVPKHVAIIMDGNGRWAKSKGMSRVFGHKNALTAVRESVKAATKIGVKAITLYAFSTENWNRPKMEVDALMSLLVHSLNKGLSFENEMEITLNIPQEACDCCPAEYVISGNQHALLYRNNDANIRDIYAVYSDDDGANYSSYVNVNDLNWTQQ